MIGKSVTIGQAPMVAGGNVGKWLVLKPSLGAAAEKTGAGVGTIGGGKFMTVGMAKSVPAAGAGIKSSAVAAAGKGAIAKGATGKGAVAAAAAKSTVATGTIWTGTGLSLGLGLGLGAWGPALLLGAATLGGYQYFKGKKNDEEDGRG